MGYGSPICWLGQREAGRLTEAPSPGNLGRMGGDSAPEVMPSGSTGSRVRVDAQRRCTEGRHLREAGKAAGEAVGGCFLIHALRSEHLLDFQKEGCVGGAQGVWVWGEDRGMGGSPMVKRVLTSEDGERRGQGRSRQGPQAGVAPVMALGVSPAGGIDSCSVPSSGLSHF